MKKIGFLIILMGVSTLSYAGEKALSLATVNFKYCLDNSKIGKQEQARFEQMRKQMERSIEQKEKELKEMSPKFSEEYLDSLTPEAETELKDKFKALSQELTQQQNQYYQTLNQTNMQVVQRMFEMIAEASKALAKEKGFDLIVNEESCFFRAEAMDVSSQIVKKLDAMSDTPETK